MRQYSPKGPKKSIGKICEEYGLFFNPNKKFTCLTITVNGEDIHIHPKDLNPFIDAAKYKSE